MKCNQIKELQPNTHHLEQAQQPNTEDATTCRTHNQILTQNRNCSSLKTQLFQFSHSDKYKQHDVVGTVVKYGAAFTPIKVAHCTDMQH